MLERSIEHGMAWVDLVNFVTIVKEALVSYLNWMVLMAEPWFFECLDCCLPALQVRLVEYSVCKVSMGSRGIPLKRHLVLTLSILRSCKVSIRQLFLFFNNDRSIFFKKAFLGSVINRLMLLSRGFSFSF